MYLSSTVRSENAVLQEKVKHLSFRVKELTIENECLKAEVEMYRNEAALPNFSQLALGNTNNNNNSNDAMDTTTTDNDGMECLDFVRAGNGIYPHVAEVSLLHLHGISNPLCCALSYDTTILATGGADSELVLCAWGTAIPHDPPSAQHVVDKACRVRCDGPVIAIAFAENSSNNNNKLVAAGCMDGSVLVIHYDMVTGKGLLVKASTKIPTKHSKYVKTVAWNSHGNVLATASGDGKVQIHQVVVKVDHLKDDETTIEIKTIETLHLQGAVESLCFLSSNNTTTTKEELCCYARGMPYLQCYDIGHPQYQLRKINLNHGGRPAAAGTSLEDQHVSFAVMDMAVSPNGKYLALATDASRNIIVEIDSGLHSRNLYGHDNDGYSNPKLAWSCNGQYLLGNTQRDSSLCVWDIASSQLVQRYTNGGHTSTIRDMCASTTMDMLVTTSFDKKTLLWFGPPS
jgi:WD40 repeat protein